MMDAKQILSWMDAYIRTLDTTDATALAEIFSEETIYQEIDPFDEYSAGYGKSLTSPPEIRERYEEIFNHIEQYHVLFHEVISVTPGQGIGRVRVAGITLSKEQWRCDWMYRMTLDSDSRCTYFQEWHLTRSKN